MGTAKKWTCVAAALVVTTLAVAESATGQSELRARDLGVPLVGTPGPFNAITDVEGLEVGHLTLVEGEGVRVRGEGPIRTGVTAILPRGKENLDPVFAAWHNINGNGEITGTAWIEDSGFLNGPMMLTNTFSVGVVRDAVIKWQEENAPDHYLGLPVVGETSDRLLNDRSGFHVTGDHAVQAISNARSGPMEQGGVGAGTGTICHQFKGGIGSASRVLSEAEGGYTVGVLVQCNYGSRHHLQVAGAPVGSYLTDTLMPCHDTDGSITDQEFDRCGPAESAIQGGLDGADAPGADVASPDPAPWPSLLAQQASRDEPDPGGSIIIVVATDAPLLPHQLHRVARRTAMGLARLGGIASNASGDLAVAFSTANPGAAASGEVQGVEMLPNGALNPIFEATIQATEESILNALVAAETMVGADHIKVHALPHDRLREILERYNRMEGR